MLSVLFQIENSQWWPADEIRRHQFKQLKPLLGYAIQHVPYYRDLLGGGVNAHTMTEADWSNIPVLTRDMLQKAGARLHAEKVPPQHGQARLQRTSGSTGKPVETLGTDLTSLLWDIFTLREMFWHKRDLSGKLAVVRYTSDRRAVLPHGIKAENWSRPTAGLIKTGETVLVSIFTPISQLAKWLADRKFDYLLTHPSVIQGLALHCQKKGLQLPSLRQVISISEALPSSLRELCLEVWGIKLVDIYSTIELGYLAIQCPLHNHYHVQSEGVFVEILDEDGNPCKTGEVGRVVVTNLHNYASPLIRYEVGDFAEVGEPCSCGRGLPVLKRIIGRYRNLITLPSGERHWPKLGLVDLHEYAPVQQFQAVQKTLHDIEFRLVTPRPLSDAETDALHRRFSEAVGDSFNITMKLVKELKRSAGGKYEEFLSEI